MRPHACFCGPVGQGLLMLTPPITIWQRRIARNPTLGGSASTFFRCWPMPQSRWVAGTFSRFMPSSHHRHICCVAGSFALLGPLGLPSDRYIDLHMRFDDGGFIFLVSSQPSSLLAYLPRTSFDAAVDRFPIQTIRRLIHLSHLFHTITKKASHGRDRKQAYQDLIIFWVSVGLSMYGDSTTAQRRCPPEDVFGIDMLF